MLFALLAITEAPYARGRATSPPGTRFIGQLYYFDDINMYFSFIRQAAEGSFLFIDRLTHRPHDPAFFNLEWLVVGRAMALMGGSDAAAFFAWRMAGLLALVFGFSRLANVVLVEERERRIALLLFVSGGGFGWIIHGLEFAGAITPQTALPGLFLKLDLVAGLHPFLQALLNPHFSLPHGLLLVLFAFFLRAEHHASVGRYGGAAVAAVVCGLVRPYDLIALWTVLPAYHLASPDRYDLRRLMLRLLPLFATAPLLLYYAWLFSLHPVFKHWASQGEVAVIPVSYHLLGLGLVGVMLASRVLDLRRTEGAADRFFLVWTLCLFVLVHAQKVVNVMPYSSQLLTSSMAPIVFLALRARPFQVLAARKGALCAFVVVNAASSMLLVAQRSRAVASPGYHMRLGEQRVFDWLNQNARPSDVILCRRADGNRLGRYVAARVAIGHYAVTPDAEALELKVDAFFRGEMSRERQAAFLDELRPRFIYVGAGDSDRGAREIPGARRAFGAGGVTVLQLGDM